MRIKSQRVFDRRMAGFYQQLKLRYNKQVNSTCTGGDIQYLTSHAEVDTLFLEYLRQRRRTSHVLLRRRPRLPGRLLTCTPATARQGKCAPNARFA